MHPVELVREAYRCYREQDLAAAERLFADDLVFTSPDDDHIGRAAFFERRFPTMRDYHRCTLLHAVDVDDHHVASIYEYEPADGSGAFRTAELHHVRDGRIHEIHVFLGGRVTPAESREVRRR